MAENNLFPRRQDIFQGNIKDVRDSVARPALDTLYQVTFSFGNYETWLKDIPGKKRTQGEGFQKKMSLLCTQAEIPGTQFVTSSAIGHHQGITEEFPNLRNFPPLNLIFYCDADMVILEVLETWMSYINPIKTNKRDYAAYSRFSYPETYKEIIHLTKFERDTFLKDGNQFGQGISDPFSKADYKSTMTTYEFVNIWPTNLTSMRVAYGDSNVLRCALTLAYDRFFTQFQDLEGQAPLNNATSVNSNDQVQRLKGGQGGLPLGTTTLRSGGLTQRGDTPYNNPNTNYRNRRRGMGRG